MTQNDSQQDAIKFPLASPGLEPAKKKKGRPGKNDDRDNYKLEYKRDFAGLWIFITVDDESLLVNQFPINQDVDAIINHLDKFNAHKSKK